MTVLRTAYVAVMPKLDNFGSELSKRIQRIDAKAAAGRVGTRIGGTIREQITTGLAAAGIGAGIGAALAAGVAGALNVGAANDKLRAQLNLTKDESARLGKVAGQLYAANYGESMGDVTGAIAKVVQAVPSLRNASLPVLKEISAGALDIARVFDQDVGGVTAAVSTMIKSGLAPNAQAALDILTKGFQSGADKGGDLLDTFTEYSVQFTKVGLDGPRALGLINQLLAGGARNADVAADAVKEFSLRAIDGSKTSAEGYKLLGLNAKDMTRTIAEGGPAARAAFGEVVERLNAMQDPVKRNAAGVALFGTKFEDLGDSFRRLDVSSLTDGLGQVAGATKGIAAQSDQDRLNSFVRTVQQGFVGVIGGEVLPAVKTFAAENRDKLTASLDAAKEAGRQVLPALKDFAGFLTGTAIPAVADAGRTVGDLVGWFREHDTTTKILVGTLAGVVIGVKAYQAAVVVAGAATTVWSVATKAAAGAQAAYNAVLALGNSTLAVWLGVKALEFAAWVRSTAAVVANTAATVASNVAMGAVRVATLAWTGVQWLLNAALSANPISLVVIAIAALVAAVVLAYQKNETFRKIVQAVWSGIQSAIGWVVAWWTGTAWPAIKKGIDFLISGFQFYLSVVKAVWSGIFSAISTAWGWIRDQVFAPIRTYITQTLPTAFRKGVDAVKTAWNNLKEAAAAPVRFMVNTVINKGVIGGINWVASKVGVKDRIGEIKLGFATGGRLPGPPSDIDNMVASSPFGPVALAGGEFVVNARQTARNLPLLEAINSGRAFADGGLLGLVRNPAGWLADRIGLNRITEKFGSNPLTKTLIGAGSRLKDMAVGRLKALVSELFGGGGSTGAGGLRSGIAGVLAATRAAFGQVPLISGVRPGATTLSGKRSYHADGRAIDLAPVRAWAEFIRSGFGPRLRELITPWQDLNLLNGRPHTYRGAVWNQHNFSGGNAHIHAALAGGGLVPVRSYDSGGYLAPGLTLAHNGTGRPEPVGHDLGRTYHITVQVPPTAHPAEVGRQVVESIRAYERSNGARWRQP
ncbi:phage tail tape measure protein [Micromonospora cathayae]|uniref:Phage tail tape measure protein n=1 Tax=Micromonospora cathayae TaxID=3028804 RepID=A0ABY7ZWI4_9ACTN|nr:phage tail tape measure protein [Micromonospora sp. HUAS 3]WDZ87181.1 phage tail tape measure protein [Micromonospora sp. HUAS 3]